MIQLMHARVHVLLCKRTGTGQIFLFSPCMHVAHLLDPVSASHHQRRQRRCSEGRRDRVALLGDVDLAVPPAPDLGRGEHATSSAHVTEGSLSSAVCASTGHTRDTRDGASSSPRLGRSLVSCLHEHAVCLPLVLVHVGVHDPDHIRPEGEKGTNSISIDKTVHYIDNITAFNV